MKIQIIAALALISFSLTTFADDSALSATPGTPPPPQGWSRPDPRAGLKWPRKKKKLKTKIQAGNGQVMNPKPTPPPHISAPAPSKK